MSTLVKERTIAVSPEWQRDSSNEIFFRDHHRYNFRCSSYSFQYVCFLYLVSQKFRSSYYRLQIFNRTSRLEMQIQTLHLTLVISNIFAHNLLLIKKHFLTCLDIFKNKFRGYPILRQINAPGLLEPTNNGFCSTLDAGDTMTQLGNCDLRLRGNNDGLDTKIDLRNMFICAFLKAIFAKRKVWWGYNWHKSIDTIKRSERVCLLAQDKVTWNESSLSSK